MNIDPTEKDSQVEKGLNTPERLVFVMPDQLSLRADNEIGLRQIWNVIWRGKWLIIVIASLFAIASVTYALVAEEWYRAEALLAPAEERATPSLVGQLGGLAALAGVSVGGGDSAEAIATLRSRGFARAFIEDLDLLPLFFADEWEPSRNQWRELDATKWPDFRDGTKYFHDNVLRVSEDRQTAMVTLAVEWIDPEVAALWANELVVRVNSRLRERALREASANVAYLQGELAQTAVVTLQQSISRLLESELQKLMLARGNEEFAFRVIDSAEVPKRRVRPKRSVISIVGTLLGGMVGVLFVFLAHAVRPETGVSS
jgi:uncharacterized protein involved in exopolysaccharide biosynthesis